MKPSPSICAAALAAILSAPLAAAEEADPLPSLGSAEQQGAIPRHE
jgi:hypothetical protein